jgi:hypothetical protein
VPRLLSAGTVVAAIVAIREVAAKVLLEADAGFFRNPSWVGIEGLEKILDLLLDLFIPRWLVVHFRLHPYSSLRNIA